MNKKAFLTTACSLYLIIANAQVDSTTEMTATLRYVGDTTKPQATEFYKPAPPVVTPGATPQDAPSDAIILFGGQNLDAWHSDKDSTKPAEWIVKDGAFTVNKKTGGIITKQRFEDYQLHVEWRIPADIHGSGQARGNSGIFLANTGPGDEGYELQVLDCYNNKTYVNGQTGAMYKQGIPLANACKKPGEWQTYDVIWTAPRFDASGNLTDSAHVTFVHYGVLLQNNFSLRGVTKYIGLPNYKAHGASPIKLQSHGDPSEPISFRNIWIRPLN